MINEDNYNPRKYLDEIILNEIEIISGIVPIQIFRMGSKEVWLLNFEVGKFIRRRLFKRAMHLTIDDPKILRRDNGSSTASVRQYDLHIRHIEKSRVIDSGMAHIKYRMNPMEIGWFSTGAVYDIDNFEGMKTLNYNDFFRLRVQKSRQDKAGKTEATLDGEIVKMKKWTRPNV